MYVPAADLQLSRGESTRDTALVLSRFLSAILRSARSTRPRSTSSREHATIPIVNGLTDSAHPLQALADAMTIRERFGSLAGVRVAYLGDGNNVCHSLMRIAARTGMQPRRRMPRRLRPDPGVVASCRQDAAASGGSVELVTDARRRRAARRCSTPTSGRAWARRRSTPSGSGTSTPYRLDAEKLDLAGADAVAMHCLPAHVGEEITADVLYGDRSLVWDQAENRLHVYKAVLALTVR